LYGKKGKTHTSETTVLKPPHNLPAAYVFILRYTSGKTINILIKLYYRTTWMGTNNKIMELFQTTGKSQKNECGISQYIMYIYPLVLALFIPGLLLLNGDTEPAMEEPSSLNVPFRIASSLNCCFLK